MCQVSKKFKLDARGDVELYISEITHIHNVLRLWKWNDPYILCFKTTNNDLLKTKKKTMNDDVTSILAEYDDTIQCALPRKSQYYDDLFG